MFQRENVAINLKGKRPSFHSWSLMNTKMYQCEKQNEKCFLSEIKLVNFQQKNTSSQENNITFRYFWFIIIADIFSKVIAGKNRQGT